MIKKTNKVSANKIMICEEDGVLMVHEFNKDGEEENVVSMNELLEDYLEKEYVSLSIGYDINL